MAESVTFFIMLPVLYVIGDFYFRLGSWLFQAVRTRLRSPILPARPDSTGGNRNAERQDQRYDHALAAAIRLLGKLDKEPDLPMPDRLAVAVYSILDSLDQWEEAKEAHHAGFATH